MEDANDIRIQGDEMKGGDEYEVARKEGKIKKGKEIVRKLQPLRELRNEKRLNTT